ncbi:uncharacterized protein HaLaN_15338, partial [Haematococcus lacustris]
HQSQLDYLASLCPPEVQPPAWGSALEQTTRAATARHSQGSGFQELLHTWVTLHDLLLQAALRVGAGTAAAPSMESLLLDLYCVHDNPPAQLDIVSQALAGICSSGAGLGVEAKQQQGTAVADALWRAAYLQDLCCSYCPDMAVTGPCILMHTGSPPYSARDAVAGWAA